MTLILQRLALAAGILLAPGLHAATFCVSTGDQFNTAMNTAALNLEDDVIKLTIGTFTSNTHAPGSYRWVFSPPTGDASDYGLAISGGWSAGNNCATQVSNDPTQTVLDAQNAGPVFFADLRWGFKGTFTLKNLTLTRGRAFPDCLVAGVIQPCEVSGIRVEAWTQIGASVIIDNILVNNGSNTSGANADISKFFIQNAGILRVRNSIFGGNTLLAAGTNTNGVSATAVLNAVMFLNNNSVYNNAVTGQRTGLHTRGVGTLSNNAIGGNTSTASPSYAFYTNEPTGLTLHHNHFQNTFWNNGSPSSNNATTTGDPGWTANGVRMVPNAVSPLRDSGLNNPPGSIPSIDFSGGARIINTTVDRGAVEAPAITRIGPTLTATSPLDGSTTPVSGAADETVTMAVQFAVSGGLGSGTTQLTCNSAGGPIGNIRNAQQLIPTGGTVTPVFVDLYVGQNGIPVQNAALSCTATRENSTNQGFYFNFAVGSDMLMSDSFE